MPKDKRFKSSSLDRAMVSPYGSGLILSDSKGSSPAVREREWEETRCPICMEIPHDSVLLKCSSSNCHPFICDTSPLHSNCLDQFRKSKNDRKLVCPLCRGSITVWTVVEEARKFMNSKTRCCSLETCGFSGNYAELTEHAMREHPSVRPTEASPTRQSNWAALRRETDLEEARIHQYTDSESEEAIPPTRTRHASPGFFFGVEGSYDSESDLSEYETDIDFIGE